ncbi:hypothetical protein GS539_21640 [Rhodococcus hoagii]|nr:hypothetical protein [Prescottella equi]
MSSSIRPKPAAVVSSTDDAPDDAGKRRRDSEVTATMPQITTTAADSATAQRVLVDIDVGAVVRSGSACLQVADEPVEVVEPARRLCRLRSPPVLDVGSSCRR